MFRPHFKLFPLVMAFALLALSGLASAQTPVEPVILNFDGDLWEWEGPDRPLIQHTERGRNSDLVLSPDGTRAAFFAYANVFTDWLQTVQGAGGFLPPQDVWLFDLPLRQPRFLAGQPDGAAFNGPDAAGTYSLRSSLSWSPDGTQLAWAELRVEPSAFGTQEVTNIVHLMVYDLVSRATRELEPSPVTANSPRIGVEQFDIVWGEAGLALVERSFGMNPVWSYRIYNPADGTRLAAFGPVNIAASSWLTVDGQDYLFDPQNPDTLLDGQLGETVTLAETVELYSLTAPDGAFFASADGDSWTLTLPGQAPVELGDDVQPYGISRDGLAALYGRYEIDPATGFYAYTVVSYSAVGPVEIGRYDDVQALSGPVGWRVAED